jgi:hypothetical protein
MLGYVLKTEKKRRVGNKLIEANKPIEPKLIEANRTNKRKGNKLIEVKNKEVSKETNNMSIEVEEGNEGRTKVLYQEDNPETLWLLDKVRQRNHKYVMFTMEELQYIIKTKIDYIKEKNRIEHCSELEEFLTLEENRNSKCLYSTLLRNIHHNQESLCLFCKLFPCNLIDERNIIRFLKGYNENSFKEILEKNRRCLKKRAYLFFFKDYLLFNIEPKTYKPKEVPLSYYIGDTI